MTERIVQLEYDVQQGQHRWHICKLVFSYYLESARATRWHVSRSSSSSSRSSSSGGFCSGGGRGRGRGSSSYYLLPTTILQLQLLQLVLLQRLLPSAHTTVVAAADTEGSGRPRLRQ